MSSHKKIILCCIPSHIGVRGNERADSAAKSAFDLSPKVLSIPYTDLKLTISKFIHKNCQQRWDMNIHNKLLQIQPTLGEWRPAFRKSRREKSRYIPIAHWSYKAYSLVHTETGTTTTVFDVSDNLHG